MSLHIYSTGTLIVIVEHFEVNVERLFKKEPTLKSPTLKLTPSLSPPQCPPLRHLTLAQPLLAIQREGRLREWRTEAANKAVIVREGRNRGSHAV
jgi:hypothetical protein